MGMAYEDTLCGLGEEPITGVDRDGKLLNENRLGQVGRFPVTAKIAAALGLSSVTNNATITAILMRNTSGAVILPGRLVITNPAGGAIASAFRATGYNTAAAARFAYVADPYRVASIPVNGLFWAVCAGPVKVLTTVAGNAVAAGDNVETASDSNGRVRTQAVLAAETSLGYAITAASASASQSLTIMMKTGWAPV